MTLGLTAGSRPSTANPQSLSLQQTWTCSWAQSPAQPAQLASQEVLEVKNLPASAGDVRDMGSIPGLGRSPGGGHGNPLQYSYLENPMDRGVWWATVHTATKSWTWLKRLGTHAQVSFSKRKYILWNKHCLPEELVSKPVKQFCFVGFFISKERSPRGKT